MINYTESFNFKPIPAITPLDGYWQNGTWKFNMSEITAGAASQPSWIDIILKGNTALTLVNSKAGSLNYLKLFGDTELLPETYIDSVTLEGKCEQNGTPTPTSPVDIVCNNGTIKYSINLFNPADNNIVMNYIISDRGNITSSTNNFYTDEFTPVKPNTDYVLVGRKADNTISAYNRICWYNSSKTFISRGAYTKNTATVNTSPSNASYARICCSPYDSVDTITLQQVQEFNWIFQEGNSEPAYQPYVEGGLYTDGTVETVTDSNGLTATAQMLLSAGDDKDTQEVISGVVTRNIGIKVFDGTESFSVVNNTYRYSLTGLKMNTKMICSHFDGDVSPSVTTSNQPDLTLKNNQSNNNNAYFKYTAKTTVEDFQQWLTDQYNAGTPVIVIFSLVDATTETVSGQFLSKSPVTYSGSITGLTGTVVESPHTTPTPTQPLDINCNNGVVKLKDSELPFGYKRTLGFACNDNVLWQITNFKLRGSDTVRISFSIADACNVFGCYQGTSANDNYDLYVSIISGAKYLRYGRGTYLSYWSNTNLGKRFDVVFSPNGTSGMPQDSTWSPLTFEAENDLLLGATTTTSTSAKLKGNLYGNFEVDNRLKLIPCERLSDNVLGYYDTYTGTFYEPTGTPTSLGYDYSALTTVGADGTVETVKITGKNLIDVTDFSIPNNSSSSTLWTGSMTGPLRLSVDKSKVTSVETPGTRFLILVVNGVTTYVNYNDTYSVAINGTLTRIKCYNSLAFAKVVGKISLQLERGTTTTAYEPYFNGGTATAEMLLKVGDYQDEQNVTTGAVVRNIGIMVLTGEEDYARRSDYAINYTGLTDRVRSLGVCGICSHFICRADNASTAPVGSLLFNVSNTYLHFFTEYGGNVEQFKQWLADQYNAGTPVIIVYPLATATTQTVTAQPLTIQAGTNIVEITQASMDNLELEVSYKAGVEVTVTEIENAQLDNSVEVTVNG